MTDPEATARKLEGLYPAAGYDSAWKPGESEQIAWESHQLVQVEIYQELGIPERACEMHSCDPATRAPITLSTA